MKIENGKGWKNKEKQAKMMNMQENQYKKQGKHRKTQETEIQKKFPKRKKKNPQTIFYP